MSPDIILPPTNNTGLNAITVPGTLRDSLNLLAVVLEQETELQPTEIMSDTAGYTDTIFGVFHLLGYQFSPRIADVGGARFWRVDAKADYGLLDELASNRINMRLVAEHWDDLLRLAGSLKLGVVRAAGLTRTLQTNDRPTRLARALQELGRLVKTLYLLRFIDDESYRRRILVQLNRGEGRHQLARIIFHGKRGELRQRYREGQEDQLGALGLVVNLVVLWNTIYMDAAVNQLRAQGHEVRPADVARLSPLGFKHVNMLGRYAFTLPDTVARRAQASARSEDGRHRRGMSRGLCRFSAPLLLKPRKPPCRTSSSHPRTRPAARWLPSSPPWLGRSGTSASASQPAGLWSS